MFGRKEERLEDFVGERELRQCEVCGAMTRNWQEHHYDYQRKSKQTVTLCLKCYKFADERRRQREAIQLNKALPPEPPLKIEVDLGGLLIGGIFFWGLIFFILMVVMTEVVRPFYYSLPITFLLLYGFYEVGKRSRKKRQEEYKRQLAKWEKEQDR
jgi:hypothetical protein